MKEVTDSNFDEFIKEGLVLLEVHAIGWCGPCKVLAPIIENISKEIDNVSFGKLDVDDNTETASKLGIRSIPSVFLYKDGEIVDQFVGVKQRQEIIDFINAHI